jgi:hypothetical protein
MKKRLMQLTFGLALATALMIGGVATHNTPTYAAGKHCHTLDMVDWWVVTGQISEYGGTLCH